MNNAFHLLKKEYHSHLLFHHGFYNIVDGLFDQMVRRDNFGTPCKAYPLCRPTVCYYSRNWMIINIYLSHCVPSGSVL